MGHRYRTVTNAIFSKKHASLLGGALGYCRYLTHRQIYHIFYVSLLVRWGCAYSMEKML